MRIVKEAEVRKNEILDAAAKLFQEKGYDKSSTNDILDAVGIARGTLYHHFKSKEEIMDALIERQTDELIARAQKVAEDKSLSIEERIMYTIMALEANEEHGGEAMVEHLHKPQNALMHQKFNKIIIQRVPPLLAGIIEDGIEQRLFNTPYPLACMEMTVVYLKTVFDDGVFEQTAEEAMTRVQALIFHLERLLCAEQGSFAFIAKLFEGEVK